MTSCWTTVSWFTWPTTVTPTPRLSGWSSSSSMSWNTRLTSRDCRRSFKWFHYQSGMYDSQRYPWSFVGDNHRLLFENSLLNLCFSIKWLICFKNNRLSCQNWTLLKLGKRWYWPQYWSVAEFKEFERRFKFKPRIKYG